LGVARRSEEKCVLANAAATALYLRGRMPLRLSMRQSEILALIATDFSDKEIAAKLQVSHHTIRKHMERLYLKNGLHSRSAAVAAWLCSSSSR
jgi:DNA-binding CsgD family transcriptional regulator